MKETKLVRKAVKGNQEALEELLIIHNEQLYRTAYIYTKNREDALDIVQDASFRAFRYIGNLNNEAFFLTWLTRILVHCAYDFLEKKKKETPVSKLEELATGKREKREEHLDLIDVVSRLKAPYRDAIILFYFKDLRISEVADVMDVPANTIKTYLRRGKKQLKKQLGGHQYYEEGSIPRRI